MPKVNWHEFKAGQEYWLHPSKVEFDKINQELIDEVNRQELKDLHKQVVDSHFEDAMRYFMSTMQDGVKGTVGSIGVANSEGCVGLQESPQNKGAQFRDRYIAAKDHLEIGNIGFKSLLSDQESTIDTQNAKIKNLRQILMTIQKLTQQGDIQTLISHALIVNKVED